MGTRVQASPRFCLTFREFIVALIYLRHGSEGLGKAEVVFNPWRYVGVLIYPMHRFEGLGMAMVLFNLLRIY